MEFPCRIGPRAVSGCPWFKMSAIPRVPHCRELLDTPPPIPCEQSPFIQWVRARYRAKILVGKDFAAESLGKGVRGLLGGLRRFSVPAIVYLRAQCRRAKEFALQIWCNSREK